MYQRKRYILAIYLTLFTIFLAACGTLEVNVEPDLEQEGDETITSTSPAVELTETSQDEPTPEPPTDTPEPTATPSPAPVQDPEPTSEATAEVVTPGSAQWTTYRDLDDGYGFALPCFWLNDGTTLRSYDDAFAMENSIRGVWRDLQAPEGVVKIDTGVLDYAEYNLDLDTSLGDAITSVAGDPYGDGRPVFESIEETTIAGRTAQRVILGPANDMWGGEGPRDSYYFPMEPGRWFRFFVLPSEAIETATVQGILSSLVLSAGEEIQIPAVEPDPPVSGREYFLNEEAGFCFQYSDEYESETFAAGDAMNIGNRVSLKLERPLYTVGLTVSARPVAEMESLSTGPVNSLDIFVKKGNILYQAVFSPSPFDNPQASADIWALYNVVTSSFSFLP